MPLRRGERYVAFIAEGDDCAAYRHRPVRWAPLRPRVTVRGCGSPQLGTSAPPGPPPPEVLLATKAGETIVTDADEPIVVEPTHGQ